MKQLLWRIEASIRSMEAVIAELLLDTKNLLVVLDWNEEKEND